ncbi:MAG: acetyl-CoA carboxylase biotin carboxylase subunit [Candidatus Puniceispirillales bacterium]
MNMREKNFKKILIANRGDVALRVQRAANDLGIPTVAVHSSADNNAMHVKLADESVCIGPPKSSESYLNMQALISAALLTGADAIHPGVGFLSENADFAEIVNAHNITFIGPSPTHIRTMGDKVAAKKAAKAAGLPLVPGSEGEISSIQQAQKEANRIGYPVIIKAASGGGGRGMKVANSNKELSEAFSSARSEAKAAFGDDTVYIEKYLKNPRHIEVQIFADSYGNVVHLGERECSIQRRHQKLFEECPSPILSSKERQSIGELSSKATKKLGYLGLGTIEYLYENKHFYFIEMNTRLQVEHPITEMVTGLDLVCEQIKVASGQEMSFQQKDVVLSGHAIECRINAENSDNFLPSPGKINTYHPPGGPGVRVDSIVYQGYEVPPFYDSLVSKLIVYAKDREDCLMRTQRALEEFIIEPIDTSIELHKKLIRNIDIKNGNYTIKWLEEKFLPNL